MVSAMNRYWRIHIDLSRIPGAEKGEEFYLDATDFDLESLLDESPAMKRAMLSLLKIQPGEGQSLDDTLRAAAAEHGDALLVRLFSDDCVNASVRFSNRAGSPHFEA